MKVYCSEKFPVSLACGHQRSGVHACVQGRKSSGGLTVCLHELPSMNIYVLGQMRPGARPGQAGAVGDSKPK